MIWSFLGRSRRCPPAGAGGPAYPGVQPVSPVAAGHSEAPANRLRISRIVRSLPAGTLSATTRNLLSSLPSMKGWSLTTKYSRCPAFPSRLQQRGSLNMVCSMLPRMAATALPQGLPNSAESAGPGLGTRFTFTLPVAGEAAAGAASGPFESTLRSSRQGQEPARVLVVDEDPEMLRAVRHELAEAGYEPLLTGDPEQLSNLIRTTRPDLVLLDLLLRGTDGIELMERVSELARPAGRLGRDETVARALATSDANYIVKPVSHKDHTARVGRRCGAWPGPGPSF